MVSHGDAMWIISGDECRYYDDWWARAVGGIPVERGALLWSRGRPLPARRATGRAGWTTLKETFRIALLEIARGKVP